jgi:hypothetical protein
VVWRILLALSDKLCTEKVQTYFSKSKQENLWNGLTVEYGIIPTYESDPYTKNEQFLCKMNFHVVFMLLSVVSIVSLLAP